MCLIMILAAAVLHITDKKHAYKSQYETILADLNRYMAKTLRLVISLMDDAINYMCMWPLA